MSDSILDQLLEAEAHEPQSWRPIVYEDLITGTCLFCDEVDTIHGTRLLIKALAQKVIMGGKEEGSGFYHIWERANIREIVTEQRLRVGDEFGLRYVKEVKTKMGAKKKIFAAIVKHTKNSQPFTLQLSARIPESFAPPAAQAEAAEMIAKHVAAPPASEPVPAGVETSPVEGTPESAAPATESLPGPSGFADDIPF